MKIFHTNFKIYIYIFKVGTKSKKRKKNGLPKLESESKKSQIERDSRSHTKSKITGPPTQISIQKMEKKIHTKSKITYSTLTS